MHSERVVSLILSLLVYLCAALVPQSVNPPTDWEDHIKAGNYLFSTTTPREGFFPNIGNGAIASYLGCAADYGGDKKVREYSGIVYLAGVFNGDSYKIPGGPSQRAPIPGVHSVYLTQSADSHFQQVGASLDIKNGIFYNRSIIFNSSACPASEPDVGVTVTLSWYAHRAHQQLLVHTAEVRGVHEKYDCVLQLGSCNYKPNETPLRYKMKQPDLQINVSNSGHTTLWEGSTRISETPEMPLTYVGAAFEQIPPKISFPAAKGTRSKSFLAVFHSSMEALKFRNSSTSELQAYALNDFTGFQKASPQSLLSQHRLAWADEWMGGIEVGGNLTIAATVNASLYYIMAAMRADVPQGSSPGGLASNSYFGHAFWDVETWMFPNIAALNPNLAKSLLQYRLDRLPAAIQQAQSYGFRGAMFPWESAVRGGDVCAWRNGAKYEHHITGDIAMAFRLLWLTGAMNLTWLSSAFPLLSGACDFFASRVTVVPASEDATAHVAGNLTLLKVIGPDEASGVHDSNVYTNAMVQATLGWCVDAAALLDLTSSNLLVWKSIIPKMYVPTTNALYKGGLVHPQYFGYSGSDINQADAALLQYPLRFQMPVEVAKNDLLYYAPLSSTPSTAGFYTGDSSYSIAWLLLGNRTAADKQFQLAFEHMDSNFYVWSEKSKNGVLGGHLNFITGAGGYLQNILYGYAGLHYTWQGMQLKPLLPPNGVTRLTLRALSFEGRRVTVSYNSSVIDCILLEGSPLKLQDPTGAVLDLTVGTPLQVRREENCKLLFFTAGREDVAMIV